MAGKKISAKRAKLVGAKLGIDWRKIPFEEFHMGIEEELEHQSITHGNLLMTGQIALDHLEERKDYYSMLKKWERKDKK